MKKKIILLCVALVVVSVWGYIIVQVNSQLPYEGENPSQVVPAGVNSKPNQPQPVDNGKANNSEVPSSGADSCTEIETIIKAELIKVNYCEKKEDCALLDTNLGCPFGCFNFGNIRADMNRLHQLALQYGESECIKCLYDCDAAPKASEIGCREGKCVDLRSVGQ